MTDKEAEIVHSALSSCLTLDGVTVEVRIFRHKHEPTWALEFISEDGMATLWNHQFVTEVAALAAFQASEEEGMSIFLDEGAHRTIH
ncbi:hypothetical protein KRR38_12490 [Novosphingobium sp. G106]|uniref:hypothetical protein n=1 Tax=Novosphingobium sp. G106 TaxID=2849500 RepID=UPI001C2DD711|nr:hypothetical protein [Novosphingobium sp. G106]MBV1688471.1 hypothetical protein [Novosphingobium sp. G106]